MPTLSRGASLAIIGYGAFGVVAILGQAIWRLTPIALEPLRAGSLSPFQLALLVGWVVVSAYTEGYRAFQLRFCPRVVARALYLGQQHPAHREPGQPHTAEHRPAHVLLAPLFCMGFFYARRRTLILAWSVSAMVVVLVILVRAMPQPWRGIVDCGVVVGLGYGVVTLIYQLVLAVTGRASPGSAELP